MERGHSDEFKKMRSQQLYDFSDPDIDGSIRHANALCAKLTTMTTASADYRQTMKELIPGFPEDCVVVPPFHCDHGNGIKMGRNVFVNYDCVILDGAYVSLGDNVKLGPKCQLYTPQHPKDHVLRRETKETSYPISIGEDTWLGGGVVVCPGVSIGKRCIIGAGSVVTHDIPDDSVAVGSPARVIGRAE